MARTQREILLPWDRQPPETVAGVDWSNPLSRGLVSVYIPPRLGPDGVLLRSDARTTVGSAPNAVRREGDCRLINSSSYDSWADAGLSASFTKQITYFALFEIDTHSAGGFVFGNVQDTSIGYNHGLYINNGKNPVFFAKTAGVGSSAIGSSVITAAGTVAMVGTYDGASLVVHAKTYSTGLYQRTGTATTGNLDTTSFPVSVARWNGGFGGMAGVFYFGGIANAAWGDADALTFFSNPWQVFEPQRIWVPVSGAGGTDYPVSISESSVPNFDYSEAVIGFARTASESSAAADAASNVAALSKTIAEAASGADSQGAVTARSSSIAESTSAADTVTASASGDYGGTVSEVASGADTSSQVRASTGTVSEAAAAADSASQLAAFARSVAEIASAADTTSGTAAGNYAGTVAEAGSAADVASNVASFTKAASESGTAADTSSQAISFTKSIAESGTALDTPSQVAALFAAKAESATAADTSSGTTTGDYAGTVAESGAAVDVQSNVASLSASTIEAASAADVAAAVRAVTALIAEAMSAADSAAASTTGDYFGVVAETGTASDTASQTAAMFGTVAESGSAADSVFSFNAWLASLSETATAAEFASQVLNAVATHSAWWMYAVPADDLSFAVSASSLAYRPGV